MSNGLVTRETNTELLGPDGEVIDFLRPTALEAVTRAEVDIQIATAKRFPRSIDRFLKDAMSMVSVDPELAEKCTYVLPGRKKKDPLSGQMVPIAGPSVRLAEIVVCCWGNLRIAGRIIDDDGKAVVAQGVCHDLERNIFRATEVRRGVLTTEGRRFKEDMVNVTCNAAIAIATRNATFQVIPMVFVHMVEKRAKEIARGDVATLGERADRALKHFTSIGVTEQEVFRALGVSGFADINLDHLATLNGFRTAIIEGHSTVEEIFRPEPATTTVAAPVAPGESKTSALKDRLVGDKPKPAPPETPPPVQESAPAAPPWSPPAPDAAPAAPAAQAPAPAPAAKPKPETPKPYLLDGAAASIEDLAELARKYGWKGKTGEKTADVLYILRENGHKIGQADKGGAS